jgi:hypothetical protein
MSAQGEPETGDATKEILLDLAKAVQSARDYLDRASAATFDREEARQILALRPPLDAFLAQLTEAQTITDDTRFADAVATLKRETASLRAVSDHIKQMDAVTAAEIEGYVEQTVTFIAQAMVMAAKLP